jgi:uncharacterized protein (UPF0548 family)
MARSVSRLAWHDAAVAELRLVGAELERLRAAELTYAEVGLTRGRLPRGYHHLSRSAVAGRGRARFEEVAQAVLGWEMHRRSGLAVRSADETVVEGGVAVLRLGFRPLAVDAPVRVVYVLDEARRKGFAYGTLPGHPETGEEAFVVELGDDDGVTFTITAFSRPASFLARAGGPVGQAVQRWITNHYLRSVQG